MQRFVLYTTIGIMAFALATPLGAAGHCNGEITDIGGVAYIDSREDFDWVYLESNGEAGLQSGGVHPVPAPAAGWSDPCNHPNPDQMVY